MSGWLLDTNVISAFAPGKPDVAPRSRAWIEERTDALFLSAITVAEIGAGIRKLRRKGSGKRADDLSAWFERVLSFYGDRVLAFDLAAARIAGEMADTALAAGRHPGFADVAIAATARAQDLIVVTLNRRHFEPLAVEAIDPFAER